MHPANRKSVGLWICVWITSANRTDAVDVHCVGLLAAWKLIGRAPYDQIGAIGALSSQCTDFCPAGRVRAEDACPSYRRYRVRAREGPNHVFESRGPSTIVSLSRCVPASSRTAQDSASLLARAARHPDTALEMVQKGLSFEVPGLLSLSSQGFATPT